MIKSKGPTDILLVEDDPFFASRVTEAVREFQPDWTVRVESAGKKAIRAIGQSGGFYKLALVDIGLPDISGIEVIKKFREKHPEAPVLVLSVISSKATVFEAIRSGAQGYLLKQGTAREIIDAIKAVLAGEYPISPSLARYLFKMINSQAAPADARERLTAKESELLQCLARGMSYSEAGDEMGVKLSTVRSHIRSLYRKLNANSQTKAIIAGKERGLIS